MKLGVYRPTRRARFEIFLPLLEGSHTTIARGIKDRRMARMMAEAPRMYAVCRNVLRWADDKGLVGLVEDIHDIMRRIENDDFPEDPPNDAADLCAAESP